ncbi:MAG: cyclic nucleotide-binding domain-containing protein [Deltaproteobacteria bacterium]
MTARGDAATPSGEGAAFLWAAGFQLCFVAAVTLFKVSANALLIARVTSASLPPLYVASALVTGLLALAFARIPRRHASAPPGLTLFGGAAIALGAWLSLSRLGLIGFSTLYVGAEAFATLISLRYWEALGHAFDPRQARRLFTLLGASGMAGAVLGGALCSLLARAFSAGALLPAGALLAAGSGLCGLGFARGLGHRLASEGAAREPSVGMGGEALHYLRRDPYPRGLAICALALSVLTAVADYLFRRRAGAMLGERDLASLFGELSCAVGFVTIAFQLGLAQRVLARFGIFRYLVLPPLGVAGSAALSLVVPGLWPIFLVKALENAGSLSVTQSGFQLLYGPVPPELSARVRGLVDGLVKKVGFALGGLLLLALGTRCSDPVLAVAALAVSLVAAALLGRQKPRYTRALAQRLSAARPLLSGALDADARALLVQELDAPETHRVLNALELLSADRGFDARPTLGPLLGHPSERVREAAVRLAVAAGATEQAGRLLEMAERDPARRPQDEAVRALASLLSPPEARTTLARIVRSDEPGLRAAAVEALYRLGDEGRALARVGLERALCGSSPAEKREAARLLGRIDAPVALERLEALLGDPDASVRALACGSAARLRDPALIEPLLRLLSDRATRRSAREALAAYGDLAVGTAQALLDDRSKPMPLRLELPRLLRYIGTARAAQALLFSNIQDDAFLRYRIGLSLSRLHEEKPGIPLDRERVREAIGRRLDAYLHYAPIAADVRAALGDGNLLVRALGDRLDQSLEVVFRLLGLVYPHRALIAAHRRFTGSDARERAQAVELLDSLVEDSVRLRLLPALDLHHRHGTRPLPGDPARLDERLSDLALSKDLLLAALARHIRRGRAPPEENEEVSVSQLGLEKILLLEGVDIFAGSSVDDLAALAAIAHERRFAAGQPIYREGEPGETLYVIVDGRVRILKAGREVLVLGAREAFGSVSLMDGAPRPADAVAGTAVRCLAIARGDFLDLVADRPELLKGVFAEVTGQLRKMLEVAAGARGMSAA